MISLTRFTGDDNKIKRSVLERNLSARDEMSARLITEPETRVLEELFIMNISQFYERLLRAAALEILTPPFH